MGESESPESDACPGLVRSGKRLHMTRWLDAHPGWKGSRRNAVISIKRASNWRTPRAYSSPSLPFRHHCQRTVRGDGRSSYRIE
jgi:hypothetical protein